MTSNKKIPLNIGIAAIIYALFAIAAFTLYGFQYGPPINIETVILFVAFVLCPVCAVIGLMTMKVFGWWYAGIILPAMYLVSAIVLWLLALNNIYYERYYANGTGEYVFHWRDGLQLLAIIAFWSAIILTPASILLLSPTTRKIMFQRQNRDD